MFRLTVVSFLAVGSAYAAACDRACLKAALDQYLNAVVEHKPAAAPLSAGFRQTENAMVRRPGTGLWESATALGKLQRRYFDPESGQAGYFGTLGETGGTAIATRSSDGTRKIAASLAYLQGNSRVMPWPPTDSRTAFARR